MMITLNLNASKTAIESTKSIHHFERKEAVLWVVLGEDWKWFDGTYALNINDEQNLKSFKDKMLEELALRAIEFNESLNWNDSYLTQLSLLYLAGSYRSNNSILWEDGSWNLLVIDKGIVCTERQLECTRINEDFEPVKIDRNASVEFFESFLEEFNRRNLISFCESVRLEEDPAYKDFAQEVKNLKTKSNWSSLEIYCKSIDTTVEKLKSFVGR
jgi:hypothetical protein